MKKLYLQLLQISNSKILSIIRTLISYNKKGSKQLSINDDLEIYKDQKEYFNKMIQSNYGNTILDFGCGTGRYLEIFKNFKFVYLVDISKENLKIASKKADDIGIDYKTKRGSLFSLDTQIDCFFSVGVFGQFYQFDSKVLKKIYSLLSDNGRAVFTIKIKEELDNEVLALSEENLINLLINYNHQIYKKNFKGLEGKEYLFNVIELTKKKITD